MKRIFYILFLISQIGHAAPVAVIRANGLNSLTLTLPCYTQKDDGLDAFTLNGRYSTGAVSYLFTKTSGPSCIIMNPTDLDTRVTKLVQGTYVFNLQVTDGVGATSNASVTVTVNAAATPAAITVDTIGTYGSTGGDLVYTGAANKICYIRAGTYHSFYSNSVKNVKFKPIGGQVIINSDIYYAFRFSDNYSTNITIDGSGIPGVTYGFKIFGPAVSDAALIFKDSSRNRTIRYVEVIGGYNGGTGGEGIGLQIYPSIILDTTTANLLLTRQNGFTQGNDTVENCYVHGTWTEGLYGGPSHHGDKTYNLYTGYFTESGPDTGCYRYNTFDTLGQAGFDLGSAWYANCSYNNFWHFGLRNNTGHVGGINLNAGSNAWIEGNDFWGTASYSTLTQGIACQGVGGWILNNTFTGCERALILLRNTDVTDSRSVPDLYIYNNTFNSNNYGWDVYSSNYAASGIHIKNNIFSGNTNNFTSSVGGYTAIDSSNNVYSSTTAAINYQNSSSRNYQLTATSPSYTQSGGLNFSSLFTKDKALVTRTSWNPGAYMYIIPGVPVIVPTKLRKRIKFH